MTIRYLKSRIDGWIFEWDEILAKHPQLYEVTKEEAYPEQFIPTEAIAKVEKKRGGKRKEILDLFTDDIPVEPGYTNDELNAEASKGL